MPVIDENGRGWIADPETGEIVEFGTPRSMAIRAKEFEQTGVALRERIARRDMIDLKDGKALKIIKEIAALFRKAERGEN